MPLCLGNGSAAVIGCERSPWLLVQYELMRCTHRACQARGELWFARRRSGACWVAVAEDGYRVLRWRDHTLDSAGKPTYRIGSSAPPRSIPPGSAGAGGMDLNHAFINLQALGAVLTVATVERAGREEYA